MHDGFVHTNQDSAAALLSRVREARFNDGLRCPRCGSAKCIRWGAYRGRWRYRCHGCGRTFNDVTGTALARTKRLDRWPAYLDCMDESLTIRDAARRVDVHIATAFRWRHRLLDSAREADCEVLSGWIEVASVSFPYSEKGRRGPRSADEERRSPLDRKRDVNVVIACDRSDAIVTAVTGRSPMAQLRAAELEAALKDRARPGATLLASAGWYSGVALFATRSRLGYMDTRRRAWRIRRPELAHVWATHQYRIRLLGWIERFRGVATRYLNNYLMWHRLLDRCLRAAFPRAAIRWPIRT